MTQPTIQTSRLATANRTHIGILCHKNWLRALWSLLSLWKFPIICCNHAKIGCCVGTCWICKKLWITGVPLPWDRDSAWRCWNTLFSHISNNHTEYSRSWSNGTTMITEIREKNLKVTQSLVAYRRLWLPISDS